MYDEIVKSISTSNIDLLFVLVGAIGFIAFTIAKFVIKHKMNADEEEYYFNTTDKLLSKRRNVKSKELKELYADVLDSRDQKNEKYGYRKAYISIIKFFQVCAIIFMLYHYSGYINRDSGYVSHLHPVASVVKEDIKVNGYYDIKYRYVDDVSTVTVFITNNSDKVLKSGKLLETSTESVVDIEKMEPGEERIISFNTKTKEKYTFDISDLEFEE